MISMRKVKNGGVAIIFGKEYSELAKLMYPRIAEKVLSVGTESSPSQQKTLSDIKQNIESPQMELSLNLPDVRTSGEKRVSRASTLSKVELRSEIARVMYSIEESFNVSRRRLYFELYERLRQTEGVNVNKVKQTRGKVSGGKTKLDTLVDEGLGAKLLNLAYELYDRYTNKN